ncbi:hypothetical protein GCM10011571_12270 [Marinithermofilum abyssi]|uniref:Branched-chain amino acid transport system / permease component n=1 Tax=Marinithermofilum abyssi TaxID=1571185 RepID=A0A8J2VCQ5_9BACL|nr:hypothetical protein [Marinithermofilum abyssi]GGE12408.1 hypothetical protein GCM10011571_12270 [Marinithermofilum abyssi]
MDSVINKRNGVVLVLIIALLLPLIVQNQYVLHVITLAFIWAISIYGYNMNVGYTGSLSLAHVGFFAIGAYTLGLLTVKAGWDFWLAFAAALVLPALIGWLIGLVHHQRKRSRLRHGFCCHGQREKGSRRGDVFSRRS